jgi:hypothetical protein
MTGLMTPTTKAEGQLLKNAQANEVTDCTVLADATVRPEFLRALVLGHAGLLPVGKPVTSAGAIRLSGAKINGELDLSYLGSASRPLPALFLISCTIDGAVNLSGTTIGEVSLRQCHLHAVRAPRASVDGQLTFSELVLPPGATIELDDITVGHSLYVNDCTVNLECQEKETGVQQERRFAENRPRLGAITLRRARVNGQLEIKNVRCGAIHESIHAEGIVVAGAVVLSEIDALGEVGFLGAKVGGQFKVVKTTLAAVANGAALNVEGCEIQGDVSLENDMSAMGEVSFAGARINGQFIADDAKLVCINDGNALFADRAEIGGGVFLKAGMTAHGQVRFSDATIGGEFSVRGACLRASNVALNIQGASVSLLVIRDGEKDDTSFPTRINGIVHANSLNAREAVSINTYLGKGRRHGLDLDGILNFKNLKARSFSLAATSLQPTDISARWNRQFAADPDCVLSLSLAEVTGALKIRLDHPGEKLETSEEGSPNEATAPKPSRGVIDLRGAKVGTLDDKNDAGWGENPNENREERIASGIALQLDGFTYDRIETKVDGCGEPRPATHETLSARMSRAARTMLHRLRWILKANEALIETRCKFIKRMYRGLRPTAATFFPQPYRELAATLRQMGHGYAGRRVLARMERDAILGSPDSGITRSFSRLYHCTFGFGYSSWKAAMTLFVIWLLASGGFWVSKNYETLTEFLHASVDAATNGVTTSTPPLLLRDVTAGRDRSGRDGAEAVMQQSGVSAILTEASPSQPSSAVTDKHGEGANPLICSFTLRSERPVTYECRDAAGNVLRPPVQRVALRKIFASEQGPYEWAPACDIPVWLYALDVMVPVLNLRAESSCGFLAEAPVYWHLFRLFVTFAGAIAIPLAALTFSGLLQRD